MQPNQEHNPEAWQPPVEAGPQAPFQAVEPDVDEPVQSDEAASPEAAASGFADDTSTVASQQMDDEALLRWQGTEYLHQEHSLVWYGVLAVSAIVLMVLALVIMHSITFALLIPVMAATLVVYTRRPPGVNDYILSRKGLHINEKLYPFASFKSFSVVTHGGAHSVVLVPRKRFQIAQTIYFPEEIGEQLVDMFAARLPMKDSGPDAIDKLLAKLHL